MSPARKRPEKNAPTPPERDVAEKQNPKQTEKDFLRDLDRVVSNKGKERLEKKGGDT